MVRIVAVICLTLSIAPPRRLCARWVQPEQSERARNSIRRALGPRRFEFLMALLTFVRSAHYWTMLHPGLRIEDDMRELMERHKDLAALLLEDPVLP